MYATNICSLYIHQSLEKLIKMQGQTYRQPSRVYSVSRCRREIQGWAGHLRFAVLRLKSKDYFQANITLTHSILFPAIYGSQINYFILLISAYFILICYYHMLYRAGCEFKQPYYV